MTYLAQIVQGIQQAKQVSEAFQPVLSMILQTINSSGCVIFVLGANILTGEHLHHLAVQKTVVENKYVDVVCQGEHTVQNACFDKIKDARMPIYTKTHLAYPILNSSGDLVAVIQLEAKYKELNKNPNSNINITDIRQAKKHHCGFNQLDEQVLKLIAHCMKMKMETLV